MTNRTIRLVGGPAVQREYVVPDFIGDEFTVPVRLGGQELASPDVDAKPTSSVVYARYRRRTRIGNDDIDTHTYVYVETSAQQRARSRLDLARREMLAAEHELKRAHEAVKKADREAGL